MLANPLGIFRARILNAGTTAQRVSTAWAEELATSVAVYNNGTTTVYLGGPDVTVAQGFPLPPGGQAAFDRVDGLYVIAASTVELRVLDGS